MDLVQLIEKRKALLTELTDIVSVGKLECRKLSNVENKEFNKITTEIESLDKEIDNKQNNNSNLINNRNNNNNKTNMEKFSLLKAIEARANGRNLDEDALNVVEAGKNEMRKSGLSFSGDIILPMEYRANIVAGTANAGQEIVSEQKVGIIEPLRDSLVLVQAGATFLTGLVGDVSIPAYSGTNALWKGEIAAAGDGAGTFSEVTLTPKRLTTYIDVSKQFLNQDSVDAEGLLMNDIVNAIAAKLQSTIFGSAAGSTTQPAGFFATAPTVAGTATWTNVVALETAVDTSNALKNTAAYITNAGGRGILKSTPKVSGQNGFILEGTDMNGYPVLVTNSVAKSLQTGTDEYGIVFGDWSQYVIGQWGAIDLVVDGISQAVNGNVRLVVNAYFDAKPRVSAAFKTGSVK